MGRKLRMCRETRRVYHTYISVANPLPPYHLCSNVQKPTTTLQEERHTQWDKINIKAKEYMYIDTTNKPSHR
jgi:hypothetical protein